MPSSTHNSPAIPLCLLLLFAVKVIECNLRASRSFPFISKTFDYNFIALATRVMISLPPKPANISLMDVDYVGVKAPMFSFARLQGADPTLGVEMMSTGEVACFGVDMYESFLLSMMAAGFRLPNKTGNILISVASAGKLALVECCARLQRLGYNLFATSGTKHHLEEAGLSHLTLLHKPSSGLQPAVLDYLTSHKIDLVINDPGIGEKDGATDGFLIRRTAIDFGVSLLTNDKCAILLSLALERVKRFHIRSMEEYYAGEPGVLSSTFLDVKTKSAV